LFIGALAYLFEHDHFFKGLGILGWLLAVAVHIWILYAAGSERSRSIVFAHGWGAVFFIGLIAYETGWQIDRVVTNDVWSGSASLLMLAAGAFALVSRKGDRRWPFNEHFEAYFASSLLLVAGYLILVIGVCINSPGDPAPLPYIPVLNPLDVLSIVAVAIMWYGLQLEKNSQRWGLDEGSRMPQLFLGGLALLLSTASVIRIVHHISGVAWHPGTLFDSVGVQSSLSIYWAILGLGGMIFGTKRADRFVWIVGAGLMAIVVLKLFVIDLGNSDTVARIVSFLGVGLMLLVVGYFSPVPPKQPQRIAE
jgi:uncharacterized membrane protein